MIKSPAVTDDNKSLTNHKVILGLSGGVDSAVAAIRLQELGAEVQALHMTNWEDDDGYCTAAADLQDARTICEQLKIPLHHVNFSRQYRDHVFNNFLAEYKAGRTPNPDVLCNREIKFGVFREHAKRLGGDLIATGHYAQCRINDGQVSLYKARDRSKDQSYFLHAVNSQALAETVFPLGDVEKSTVRGIARDHGLAVHDKKDSTGICFIGERPFREFLATFLPASPGPMETPDGIAVGEHQGLMYYTLGQRQGLGIGGLKDAGDEPWYVAAKNLASNTLIVVQGDHPLLYSESIEATDAHWIGSMPDALAMGHELDCAVKIRYRQNDQPCRVTTIGENRLGVTFAKPQMAVTPGQFAVFYAADRCLGGAVIDSARIADSAKDALRKTG
jgi:tRNA-specific 2-thiouridylase